MTNYELTEKIKQILIKKAQGYDYSEETYEYQRTPSSEKQLSFDDLLESDDNTFENQIIKKRTKINKINDQELILLKKKVTTHHIPPDMLAIKILLENFGSTDKKEEFELEKLSDTELLALKDKILENLNNIEEEDNES